MSAIAHRNRLDCDMDRDLDFAVVTARGAFTNRRAGRSWGSMLIALLLAPAILAGCATREDEPGGGAVLAPSLRAIGLARHHVDLALGRHTRNLGPGAEILPGAAASVRRACSGSRPSVTWLGHSSAIIHVGGRCLLTDPVLAPNRSLASPLPRRLVEIPLRVEDLPPIDAIILSHGDFDHLHMPTLRALIRRFPDIVVLVPPGAAGPVALGRLPQVIRSRLGEALRIHGLTITAERAYHATRRNLAALRTGEAFSWVVTDGRTKILFIGDTAYGPAFKEIFGLHGAIDLLLVPIGAHEPRELVAGDHVNPEEAARIAHDVQARLAIGIHWGTFALSPDLPDETVRRFRQAGRETGVTTQVLPIGGTVAVP